MNAKNPPDITDIEGRAKRQIFEGMIALNPVVCVYLDARWLDVQVPEQNRSVGLKLEYGFNMPVPIPDLSIDDYGISATLSFNRTPHKTFVPWSRVFVIANTENQGIVFKVDVPKEVQGPKVDPKPETALTLWQGEQEKSVTVNPPKVGWTPKVIKGGMN